MITTRRLRSSGATLLLAIACAAPALAGDGAGTTGIQTITLFGSGSSTTTLVPPTTLEPTTTTTLVPPTTLEPTTTTTLVPPTTTTMEPPTTTLPPETTTTLEPPSTTLVTVTTTTTTTTLAPGCGNGQVDAGEVCGEPALSACESHTVCAACTACVVAPFFEFSTDDDLGEAIAGQRLVYRVRWGSPSLAAEDVSIVVTLAPELSLSAMRTGEPFRIDGNRITIDVGALDTLEKDKARVRVRVRDDELPGTLAHSTAEFFDAAGRHVSAARDLVVREGGPGVDYQGLGLRLRGTNGVSNGGGVTFKAKYRNAAPQNTVVMSLPANVGVTRVEPAPTSTDGTELTWQDLRAGSGHVEVAGFVTIHGLSGDQVIVTDAQMSDSSGESIAKSHATTVFERTGEVPDTLQPLALEGRSVGSFRPGLVNTLRFEYRGMVGTGALEVTLPPELSPTGFHPTPSSVSPEGIVRWEGLRRRRDDDFRIDARISDEAAPGTLLEVPASMTDSDETVAVTVPVRIL